MHYVNKDGQAALLGDTTEILRKVMADYLNSDSEFAKSDRAAKLRQRQRQAQFSMDAPGRPGRGDQMAFNGLQMRELYPQDRYEIKLGADLQRGNGWTGWGNVGWEFGSQSYRALTGRVGVKYTW